jgi:hypothetical protein
MDNKLVILAIFFVIFIVAVVLIIVLLPKEKENFSKLPLDNSYIDIDKDSFVAYVLNNDGLYSMTKYAKYETDNDMIENKSPDYVDPITTVDSDKTITIDLNNKPFKTGKFGLGKITHTAEDYYKILYEYPITPLDYQKYKQIDDKNFKPHNIIKYEDLDESDKVIDDPTNITNPISYRYFKETKEIM